MTDAEWTLDLCGRIASCTEKPGTITRLFCAPSMHEVHRILRVEMERLGMQVRVDAAGNLRGLYGSGEAVLLMGSHIDTVPDAGAFDGVLGVAIALAALRSLPGKPLPFAVEVIAFSEEEGVRFGLPFIGSRALVGTLGQAELARKDAGGISVRGALHGFGVDPDCMVDAGLTPGTFAFFEVHIEQGPVLESLGLPLGIVTDIIGQARYELTFQGCANHAGTTPMHLRSDALGAAAAWVTAVEDLAQSSDGLVATVGRLEVSPGAVNVVPGRVVASLDVRHASSCVRDKAVAAMLAAARHEAAKRGVQVAVCETSRQDAVAMDDSLCSALERAVAATGTKPFRMVSGAGHDAMMLAGEVPAAMLFVRTPGGVSHHPDESVAVGDVQLAIGASIRLIEELRLWLPQPVQEREAGPSSCSG